MQSEYQRKLDFFAHAAAQDSIPLLFWGDPRIVEKVDYLHARGCLEYLIEEVNRHATDPSFDAMKYNLGIAFAKAHVSNETLASLVPKPKREVYDHTVLEMEEILLEEPQEQLLCSIIPSV